MKSHTFLVLGLALVLGSSAFSQSEATLQAERWFRDADKKLNRVYQELHARLTSDRERDELTKAQRAWIAFRDSDSTFRARITSAGGSAYSMDYLGNLAEMTEARTKQLEGVLKVLP